MTTPTGRATTPYWNVNVPLEDHTSKCPAFLTTVDAWDKEQLATKDEDYVLMDWVKVMEIVRDNRLEQFKRIPSELRRYRKYIADVKASHGSVMDFIMQERLGWKDVVPSDQVPFASRDDYKSLYNDWPYGIEQKIVHLVVWTKFGFEEDEKTGDLTEEARASIDGFIREVFMEKLGDERVLWFKNWSSLKSVHAIEHFHVLLYDPDPAFIEQVTDEDTPVSKRSSKQQD